MVSCSRLLKLVACFILLVFLCYPYFVFADTGTLSVNATVLASPDNFPTTLVSTTAGTQFNQNQTIGYKINYGSTLNTPTTITVVASWSQGTVEGSGTPSVDVLDYVAGSAENAYGNTPPVIDTVNRTITWTISSFPANTLDQTVSFQLKTTSNYTDSNLVDFSVAAHTTADGVSTPDSTVNQKYLFMAQAPTPTGIPRPTSTPGPITPTPLNPQNKPVITQVDIRSITATTGTIAITADRKTTVSLIYGTSPTILNQTITDQSSLFVHQLTLTHLLPDTHYYFRFILTDADGNKTTSDLYTFLTAKPSSEPLITIPAFTLTSGNTILFPNTGSIQNFQSVVILPIHTSYSLRFRLSSANGIKQVMLILRPKNVLGTTTTGQENEKSVIFVQTEPGVYSGTLMTTDFPSEMTLFVRTYDNQNNITETKLADVYVSLPFTVLDKQTRKPVEHAKITLSLYNLSTKKFELITQSILSITNPDYTNNNGQLPLLTLPQERYQVKIEAIGYGTKITEFTLGENAAHHYPQILISKQPFSFMNLLRTMGSTATDLVSITNSYISSLAGSNRYFNFIGFVILSCFVLLTFLSFGTRLELSLGFLPWFIRFKIQNLSHSEKYVTLGGRLRDSFEKPVGKANIFISDPDTKKVIGHTMTNHFGQFMVRVLKLSYYEVSARKVGYKNPPSQRFEEKVCTSGNVQLTLTKHLQREHNLKTALLEVIGMILGLFFEALLVVSLVLELLFGHALGWIPVLPFIMLSLFNGIVWLFHMSHLKQQENIS